MKHDAVVAPAFPEGAARSEAMGDSEGAPDEAKAYVPPVVVPARTRRDTLEVEPRIEVAPQADPRRAHTVRKLDRPDPPAQTAPGALVDAGRQAAADRDMAIEMPALGASASAWVPSAGKPYARTELPSAFTPAPGPLVMKPSSASGLTGALIGAGATLLVLAALAGVAVVVLKPKAPAPASSARPIATATPGNPLASADRAPAPIDAETAQAPQPADSDPPAASPGPSASAPVTSAAPRGAPQGKTPATGPAAATAAAPKATEAPPAPTAKSGERFF